MRIGVDLVVELTSLAQVEDDGGSVEGDGRGVPTISINSELQDAQCGTPSTVMGRICAPH